MEIEVGPWQELRTVECSESKHGRRRLKRTAKRLKREKEASQGQTSGSKKSKLSRHCRRRHLLKKVKRSPFLSDLEYAEYALALYEKEPCVEDENTQFEVVEALDAHRTLLHFPDLSMPGLFDVGDCCHVRLYAKPKHPDDAPTYFFFFELLDFGSGELELEKVVKLKPAAMSRLSGCCKFCPTEKEYPHPEGCKSRLGKVPRNSKCLKMMEKRFKRQLIKTIKQRNRKPKQVNESEEIYTEEFPVF